jgi:hypothetical protein
MRLSPKLKIDPEIYNNERREEREKERGKKDLKDTETLMTTLSASLERYQRDEFNDIKEGHNGDLMSRPNMLGLTCLLDDLCGTLQSLLVTFLAVVEFILSKSFQRYRQCHYQSFDVPLRFLLLFICSLSPLSSL